MVVGGIHLPRREWGQVVKQPALGLRTSGGSQRGVGHIL